MKEEMLTLDYIEEFVGNHPNLTTKVGEHDSCVVARFVQHVTNDESASCGYLNVYWGGKYDRLHRTYVNQEHLPVPRDVKHLILQHDERPAHIEWTQPELMALIASVKGA